MTYCASMAVARRSLRFFLPFLHRQIPPSLGILRSRYLAEKQNLHIEGSFSIISMDLPPDLDDYIHQSIQNTVGLPVPTKTLGLKLLASEQSRHRLQDQIFLLQDRLKDKDERIERLRAEASMSALALRKQIEDNQRLAGECTYLESQNTKWERECTLYERDRDALMEFGNDADERAKAAEIRAMEAEENLRSLAEELKYYEHEFKMAMAREEKAVEEMRVLRQQIDEVGNERFEGTGCDNFTCSQCSRLKKENQELLSRLPNTAVSAKLYVTLSFFHS
ncbi:hypothetical protein ACLOJK_017259 [Asimina triloba]